MPDPFEFVERIGRGGMGEVWQARDRQTGDVIAVKVIHPHLVDSPEFLRRFEHEAKNAARIDSPYIVQVLGYGSGSIGPYLALEYVEGDNLRVMVKRDGAMPFATAQPIFRQLVAGLAAVHAAGIIHRDVKPSNVLIDTNGHVKLADFGISRAFDATRITRTDQAVGTPSYMAPEGQRDERSDLYSLGCVLYEMVTGVPPFEGDSEQEVIRKHINDPIDFDRTPEEAHGLLRWLLSKRAAQRPQTASHLLAVLDGAAPLPFIPTRLCPFCEAEISPNAQKCRFCGEWVTEAAPMPAPEPVGAPVTEHLHGVSSPVEVDTPGPTKPLVQARPAPARALAARRRPARWRQLPVLLNLAGVVVVLGAFLLVPGNTSFDKSVAGLAQEIQFLRDEHGFRGEFIRLAYLWWLMPIAALMLLRDTILAVVRGGEPARMLPFWSAAAGITVIGASFIGFAAWDIADPFSTSPFWFPITGFRNDTPAFPFMTVGGVLMIVSWLLARRAARTVPSQPAAAEPVDSGALNHPAV